MSAELFIQPSQMHAPAGAAAGQWVRGIPVPGAPMAVNPIPAVSGIATCNDLLAGSPPNLLQRYEVYSYSIGWGIFVQPQEAAGELTAELALLVNDHLAYTTSQTLPAINEPGGGTASYASGAWVADLVNHIMLGGRDRLTLRAGAQSSEAVTYLDMYVGVQQQPAGASLGPAPFESTISYNVTSLPPRRRL